MKKVKKYICAIKDETHGAAEYAENYIIYKTTNPRWSQMYGEMAKAELIHADYLREMGQEFIASLNFVPEECREAWEACLRHCAEKAAAVRLMLSK